MNIGKTHPPVSPLFSRLKSHFSQTLLAGEMLHCHFVAPHCTLSSVSRSPSGWQRDPVGEAATPPSFVPSADLLRLHPAPPFRWIKRMLNRTAANTDPSHTPSVSAADQCLWAQPGRQSSAHLTISSSSPNFSSFSPRILQETMSKAFLKSRYMVYTAPPCLSRQSSHHRTYILILVYEDEKIQIFPFTKYLTYPGKLFFFLTCTSCRRTRRQKRLVDLTHLPVFLCRTTILWAFTIFFFKVLATAGWISKS